MRIAIFDNWSPPQMKFSHVLRDYWVSKGHTVNHEMGFNPNLVETCDRVFFESADTNAHLAAQQRVYKKGKLFVRMVDIDIHGSGPGGLREGYFDGYIYIADHMREMAEKRFPNLHGTPSITIPMGVDLNVFTFRQRPVGKHIALISTRLTPEKGFDRALMIFAELVRHDPSWRLHVVGRKFENSVWNMHIDQILDVNDMRDKVTFYGNLPYETGREMNTWLEDKDYLLSSSHKEAFSFAIGEAMAKGIKPVAYNFWGADRIWPSELLYRNEHEAVRIFLNGSYEPTKYRHIIEERYSLERHVKAMSDFMEVPQ